MADQGKRVVHDDLPSVETHHRTSLENSERRQRLLQNSVLFVALYSCLHKVLIPVALQFLKTTRPEYEIVDAWFLPAITLGICFKFYPQWSYFVGILCGSLIAHAVLSVWHVLSGHATGWLMFSHILSSVPMAGLCIVILGKEREFKKIVFPWVSAAGVFLLASFFSPISQTPVSDSMKSKDQSSQQAFGGESLNALQGEGKKVNPLGCGSSGIAFYPENVATLAEISKIEIKECGFYPAMGLLNRDRMVISNSLSKSINVHILVRSSQGDRRNQNLLIGPHQEKVINSFQLGDHEAALVYSDAQKEFGATAIVTTGNHLNWFFSRLPLKVESR